MRITKNFHLCLSCFMSEPLLYFLCDNGPQNSGCGPLYTRNSLWNYPVNWILIFFQRHYFANDLLIRRISYVHLYIWLVEMEVYPPWSQHGGHLDTWLGQHHEWLSDDSDILYLMVNLMSLKSDFYSQLVSQSRWDSIP